MSWLSNSQKEHRFTLESCACEIVRSLLESAKWIVHAFDWFPMFSFCRKYDLYEENKTLFPESYELYRPSRPDFLAKSPTQSKCLVEVKGKSKHDLIVDDYKYDSYIYWERYLGFPVFIVFYVSSEARKGQTGLYLHKVQDVDIRVGEIRYDGKGFVNIENRWNAAAVWRIKHKEELAKELNGQLQKWNPSHSYSRWEERKGLDLITKAGMKFLIDPF